MRSRQRKAPGLSIGRWSAGAAKGTGHDSGRSGLCEACHGHATRHDDVHHLVVNLHAQAMISTCWTLGAVPELQQLRLRPWTHMLGFKGHFSTRSRCYSTTLTALRHARRDWRDQRLLAGLGRLGEGKVFRHDELFNDQEDEETVLIIGHWQYIGRGHSPGEAIFARTIAHDIFENRRLVRHIRQEEEGVA